MFGDLRASRRLLAVIDSKPMTLPQQPLRCMRSISGVSRDVEAGLADPANLHWYQCFAQVAQGLPVRSNVVVDKNRKRRSPTFDLT